MNTKRSATPRRLLLLGGAQKNAAEASQKKAVEKPAKEARQQKHDQLFATYTSSHDSQALVHQQTIIQTTTSTHTAPHSTRQLLNFTLDHNPDGTRRDRGEGPPRNLTQSCYRKNSDKEAPFIQKLKQEVDEEEEEYKRMRNRYNESFQRQLSSDSSFNEEREHDDEQLHTTPPTQPRTSRRSSHHHRTRHAEESHYRRTERASIKHSRFTLNDHHDSNTHYASPMG